MKMQTFQKPMTVDTGLKIKIMGFFILMVSTGFVWMATDQVIATPMVRTLDLLWRLLVCRCLFQFDLLQ